MSDNMILLAITDDEVATAALAKALDGAHPGLIVKRIAPSEANAAIRSSTPEIALILLDTLDTRGSTLVSEVVRSRAETAVIVALAKQDKSALVGLIKLGASDVVNFPFDATEVRAAVSTLANRRSAEKVARASRIWSVFGAGGGCGVTMLAVNLAERLARLGGTVAVADLNLEMGDVPVFLNMKPRYTLTDVVLNSAKLDSSYLNSTVATHASGLKVLPGPREIEDSEEVTPTRLRTVLRQLRGIYDHLVIDTPSVFNETTIEALDHSDAVLLVAMLNIPSVRNAKRIRAAFDRLGYPAAKIRLVVNRADKRGDISPEEASALVGLPVFDTIPNDYPSVIRAINVGEPVASVAPRAPVTKAIEGLASKLRAEALSGSVPADAGDGKGGFRLFGRKKET